jgi:FkbM family methyltransferase
MNAAATILEDAGASLVCVDAGSAGGFHPRFLAVGSRVQLIGFEPDPAECARLQANATAGQRYLNSALGRADQDVVLHLHRKRNTSSVYATDTARVGHFDNAARLDVESTVPLRTRSLDDVARSEGLPSIDYLKVDVEGHELAILQGYSGPMLMAEIEVTFHPFRKDVPLFDEVMRHMRSRGLFLLDLRRMYWSPTRRRDVRNHPAKGMLMFGDALFALDPYLEGNRRLLSTPAERAKYLALFCVYGYPAEALMCLDVLKATTSMEEPEFEQRRSAIIRTSRSRKWARPRLARLLLWLESWCSLPVAISEGLLLNDDAQTDGELGNWDTLAHLKEVARR